MIAASREGDIAVIEIARHERRNALDTAHCEALREAVQELAGSGARAIVITGTGSTFSVGASFAIPTARLGLAVDPWTIRRLAALSGVGTAQAVLVGCDTLDAARALGCGLGSRAGNRDAALAWAHELASLAPLTLAYSKRALNQPADDAGLLKAHQACWASDDCSEGQRARVEKRPPRFQGR